MRERRQNETAEETQGRRDANSSRDRARRGRETKEEKQERCDANANRQRNRRIRVQVQWKEAALNYDPSSEYTDPSVEIGQMSDVCTKCQAKKWPGEPPGMCCSSGKVRLPSLPVPPPPLWNLLVGDHPLSKTFLNKIRSYNSAFQMTSFGSTREVRESGFMPTFKIQGQVYHRIGSLFPGNAEPKFLQIYFMGDASSEASRRATVVPGLKLDLIQQLQEMLHSRNALIQSFKSAIENLNTEEHKILIRADKTPSGEHNRRFNAPQQQEVAVLLVNEDHGKRDIIIQQRDSQLQRISETHRSYDALQYPLIFLNGQDGYHFQVWQTNPENGQLNPAKKVSCNDYYAHLLMIREGQQVVLHLFRDLFHQFAVDMYAKVESERLCFIRLNQTKLRAESYIHLKDALNQDGNTSDLGQLVILPSTFTGGPRYMHERTQDAMTYVRNFGKPTLFITFTCNPSWGEIRSHLMPGQEAIHRHDIVARVFKQKLIKLMGLFTKGQVFGATRCYMYTVEWQKRGLPHAHILLWLKDNINPNQIDSVISAEIPNKDLDPELYEIVTTQMIHGPCGVLNPSSPCMQEKRCTKRFPRDLLQETQTGHDGYPSYRRRKPEDGGFTFKTKVRQQEVELDNSWVVPYNSLLSKVFKAHINVEFCNSVKSIKYVCKYINKGSDMAVFEVSGGANRRDEVTQFQLGRYISTNEAIWRLLNFPIHERHPAVVHLNVHLEGGQRIYFNPDTVQAQIESPKNTTLTAFFNLCQSDTFAATLLYPQVPKYYTWIETKKEWKRRSIGEKVDGHPDIRSTDIIGRVYTIHPNMQECFFLRMLLHQVKGPTSFAHLRTFEGHVCQTYREACHR